MFLLDNQLIAQEKEFDKRTPFNAVKYIEDIPFVLIDEEWREISSIEGYHISKYIELAVIYDPLNWKKAFHRWIHYMFDDLEIERDEYVDVSFLVDDDIKSKRFLLKLENRELATTFHDSISKIRNLNREIIEIVPSKFEYLTKRIYGNNGNKENWVTRDEALSDLNYLEYELNESYSYLTLNNFDYTLGLDAIRNAIGKGINKRDFALQLKMFLANFGDGHTSVSFKSLGNFKSLPFRILKHKNCFYAVDPDRKSAFEENFPILKSINGIEIDQLFETAAQIVSKTTYGYVESSSLSYMRYIEFVLRLLGMDVTNYVDVKFYNVELNKSVYKKIEIGDFDLPNLRLDKILYDSILENQIGYLAFNLKMFREDTLLNELKDAMTRLGDTKSLVIDIRGNGGGSRDFLVTLMPYFIKEPTVLNVGRYRVDYNPSLVPKNGFLERRFLFPLNADDEVLEGRSDSFQKCVLNFNKTFKPKVEISDTLFSAFHYMVSYPLNSEDIFYNKTVIVLVDENCFSASDIFAAGIQQAPNVLLMGNVTGGGSGYADTKLLPFSNISLRLSRMFSYQPNGENYDGVGVTPDIHIPKTLLDKMGITDSQLDFAINYLSKK